MAIDPTGGHLHAIFLRECKQFAATMESIRRSVEHFGELVEKLELDGLTEQQIERYDALREMGIPRFDALTLIDASDEATAAYLREMKAPGVD